ncbi:hypothetical protein BO71DRAFT_395509 [Aspergillus ellipticus CBS 707.79]|uniref:Uncharacterized protein n=1 Tax=Aspergillus ellipticus CBS 707.79 TaxID=1448320 RepID=A0A319E368_9EURO|nr:hypothetical protein BO71DRAFT_395509 [Aspergillus ellipticus CBS 707.79]
MNELLHVSVPVQGHPLGVPHPWLWYRDPGNGNRDLGHCFAGWAGVWGIAVPRARGSHGSPEACLGPRQMTRRDAVIAQHPRFGGAETDQISPGLGSGALLEARCGVLGGWLRIVNGWRRVPEVPLRSATAGSGPACDPTAMMQCWWICFFLSLRPVCLAPPPPNFGLDQVECSSERQWSCIEVGVEAKVAGVTGWEDRVLRPG